jgi:hypothetical protein
MKKTLWTFGDSFTESLSTSNGHWAKLYCEWKGYTPKVYGEILADRFDFNLMNYGGGGLDNYTIFQIICDVSNNIMPNDVIIIGWSSTLRFRVVDRYGKWVHIVPNFNWVISDLDNVSKRTIEETLINRTNLKYTNEVHSWIKLLRKTFSNNLMINWSTMDENISNNYVWDIPKIVDETNGEIQDGHYGEIGHMKLSDIFTDMINSNTSSIAKLI